MCTAKKSKRERKKFYDPSDVKRKNSWHIVIRRLIMNILFICFKILLHLQMIQRILLRICIILLDAAGILEYEKVQIVDVNNGARFETYTIAGERGSGMICLNGAAARCASVKDKVIIMSYADMTPEEAKAHRPSVVFVDEINRIDRVTNYEKHGQLFDKARLDEE